MDAPVLHTTRGTLNPETLDDARQLHNAFVTQGPQPGIEIARSLGDLSHNLYSPADGAGDLSDAKPGELLFIDYWAEPDGMETFFAHPSAQKAADPVCVARRIGMEDNPGRRVPVPRTRWRTSTVYRNGAGTDPVGRRHDRCAAEASLGESRRGPPARTTLPSSLRAPHRRGDGQARIEHPPQQR